MRVSRGDLYAIQSTAHKNIVSGFKKFKILHWLTITGHGRPVEYKGYGHKLDPVLWDVDDNVWNCLQMWKKNPQWGGLTLREFLQNLGIRTK